MSDFFRADSSGNIPGTGLGMSIVKEILELHGGAISIVSSLGIGSTVSVWLPRKIFDDGTAAFPTSGLITKLMTKNKKILVIDDRREVRFLISTALRNSPFDVIEASCGEDALTILEVTLPDLIFLDIVMPAKMDG